MSKYEREALMQCLEHIQPLNKWQLLLQYSESETDHVKGKDKHLLMKQTQNSHRKTMSYFFILLKAMPLDLACELETEDLANNYISIQNSEFLLLSPCVPNCSYPENSLIPQSLSFLISFTRRYIS